MKKLLSLGFAAAMFATSQAHAGFIWTVTGSDMAGIEVTAVFSNQTSETLTWADLGGNAGGVNGTGWSLMVDGDTMIPNFTTLAGAWILSNTSQSLVSLFIDLGTAFVFDTIEGPGPNNGSGPGRYVGGVNRDQIISTQAITANFGGLVIDELYSSLLLTNIASGETKFAMDTDAVAVSAPASLSIFALSLLGLAVRSRRKQA